MIPFKTFLNLLILTLVSISGSAQSYVDISAGIAAVSRGSGSWGDFDNDTDLDLLITGEDGMGNPTTKIYINNEGAFSESTEVLPGVINGMACWNDFNCDGALDILITGENDDQVTYLFVNEEGTFEEIEHSLGYFDGYSSASWGDFDNDGDPDLFLTGSWNSVLYRNDGDGNFTETENSFTGLSSSRSYWVDFDKDQDMDLFVTGDTGGGMKLYACFNENGSFEENELALTGLSAGSIELADYDADGDPDILIMGFNDNVEPEANIYRNDGDLLFTNIWAGLPPVALGRASWGDCDNDGDLDVAITGKLSGCGVFVSDVYENVGNDYFNSQNLNLQSAEYSYLAWGDFDKDTDLDLFICGLSYSGGPFSKVYRNDASLPNFIPEPPQNLEFSIEDDNIHFSWDPGSDVQTESEGLTYNLRVGTAPSMGDVCSSLSHSEDGTRKIAAQGNASQCNSWAISGLEEGTTYYWSVQTIDPTHAASEFSEEQSFVYTATGVRKDYQIAGFSIYPNPVRDGFRIEDAGQNTRFELISSQGEILMEFISGSQAIQVGHLPKGLYWIRTTQAGKTEQVKLLVI